MPLRVTFANLGMSPFANAYLKPEQLYALEPFYPLQAFVCEHCLLAQLEAFESPDKIFNEEYAYFASYSDSWLQAAKNYVEMITGRFGLTAQHQVIEVASNDGYLLRWFVEKGIPVLGVEPSAGVAKAALAQGIPTRIQFFGEGTARQLAAEGQQADLIIGNNVLAHVPNVNDFVAGLQLLLKPGGVLTMEFHHVLRLIEENQFDTIYHEHFSYFSFTTARKVFEQHGLALFDVEEIPVTGGSLRIYGCHADDPSRPIGPRVGALLAKEEAAGLTRLETYTAFSERVQAIKRNLLAFLIDAKEQGKSLIGYGAAAKGNTLLNYCGVGTDFLDYVVDRSPYKQGLYLPGTHIPIVHPDRIRETRPDYVLMLPWNIKAEIMEQLAYIGAWGGKFLALIPGVKIYDPVDRYAPVEAAVKVYP